jgi:transcriptional regulator with XRE-family HTH domain
MDRREYACHTYLQTVTGSVDSVTRSERRPCQSCGAHLAADNRGDQCGPCQRRAPEPVLGAPRLPDDFWTAAALAEAAAERHFGKLLLAYRKLQRPEPTQALVGQWLGLTQGQVSRIERGSAAVQDLGKLDRWASALHIPQQLLWFNLTVLPADQAGQHDRSIHTRQPLTAVSCRIEALPEEKQCSGDSSSSRRVSDSPR